MKFLIKDLTGLGLERGLGRDVALFLDLQAVGKRGEVVEAARVWRVGHKRVVVLNVVDDAHVRRGVARYRGCGFDGFVE
jgi:hypothetical protein